MARSENRITEEPQVVDRNANVYGRRRALRVLGLAILGTTMAACLPSGPESSPSPRGQLGIPTSRPGASGGAEGSAATATSSPAVKAENVGGNTWRLMHPDEDGKMVDKALPEGFIPDKGLHVNTDISPLPIGDLSQYSTPDKIGMSNGNPNGVGYNYDYNDACQVPGFLCNQQMDMFAWRIDQGQEVRVPGIGTLKGGPRRSVVLLYFNLTDHVNAFDVESHGPIYIKRGFTATGRIFNGDNIQKNERDLSGFWLYKQGHGEPSKSYIGITDSPDNALETLLVTVVRKQWGNNSDGSPRFEDQLVRADVFKVK